MSDTVTISKEDYYQMVLNTEILSRLEAGGVDNWTFFDESVHGDQYEDIDVFKKDLKKQLDIK